MTTSQQPLSAARPTVLLIEDNADHSTILEWAFLKCFQEVTPVWRAGPDQAMQYLETCQKENALPKLILLDMYLPHFELGHQLLLLLKATPAYQDIPVLALTVSSQPRDVLACYQGGCNSYLIKPNRLADWETLLTSIRAYWWELDRRAVLSSGS